MIRPSGFLILPDGLILVEVSGQPFFIIAPFSPVMKEGVVDVLELLEKMPVG